MKVHTTVTNAVSTLIATITAPFRKARAAVTEAISKWVVSQVAPGLEALVLTQRATKELTDSKLDAVGAVAISLEARADVLSADIRELKEKLADVADVDFDKVAAALDYKTLADRIDLYQIEVDYRELAYEVDASAVADYLDVADVAENLSIDSYEIEQAVEAALPHVLKGREVTVTL